MLRPLHVRAHGCADGTVVTDPDSPRSAFVPAHHWCHWARREARLADMRPRADALVCTQENILTCASPPFPQNTCARIVFDYPNHAYKLVCDMRPRADALRATQWNIVHGARIAQIDSVSRDWLYQYDMRPRAARLRSLSYYLRNVWPDAPFQGGTWHQAFWAERCKRVWFMRNAHKIIWGRQKK